MGVKFYIVCEDSDHEQFLRGLLEGLGLIKDWAREVRCEINPNGGGDAKAFVRRLFPEKVQVRRSKAYQHGLAVIGVSDGDDQGHGPRVQSLLTTLHPPRTERERIAVLAPTWSIETWVLWLLGNHSVTEARTYKTLAKELEPRDIREAGRCWNPASAEEHDRLPSLHAARRQVERLL